MLLHPAAPKAREPEPVRSGVVREAGGPGESAPVLTTCLTSSVHAAAVRYAQVRALAGLVARDGRERLLDGCENVLTGPGQLLFGV
ncbi:hypothetical protein ACIBCS_06750 [Streptomyces phaeochromogenes]|uniref:hypothetical protein n=1 Tax=Streptomyces phaeochromogenes TaxID=1923 RepID=UPI0033D07B76